MPWAADPPTRLGCSSGEGLEAKLVIGSLSCVALVVTTVCMLDLLL